MIVNAARFLNICYEHNIAKESTAGIGTLREKRLHSVLKEYYDSDKSHHEIPYLGYVADIKNEDGITEIQTGALNPLYPKLAAFLPNEHVTIVHPVAVNRTISWIDPQTGDITQKHKSPKHGSVTDALIELYNIRSHLSDPNLTINIVMIEVDEYRYRDGWSRDGKKGSHRYERIPVKLFDIITLNKPEDYYIFLPDSILDTDKFTVRDYKTALKINQRAAYYAVIALENAGVIKRGERTKSGYVYTRIPLL